MQLKFRMFDGKRMWYSDKDELIFKVYDDGECVLSDDVRIYVSNMKEGCSEPMQWTGLYDKNGVEIYEGDIVIDTRDDKNQHLFVGFIEGSWCLRYCKKTDCYYESDEDFPEVDNGLLSNLTKYWEHENVCEVIGNIYESEDKS